MSILLDTGVLHGFLNRRDARHGDSQKIIADAKDAAYGTVTTTTFILDEAISLTRVRKQPYRTAEVLLALVGLLPDSDIPHFIRLLEIGSDDLPAAIRLQERLWDRGLSFTDCTSLHVMQRDGLDAIATFDGGFQGLATTVPTAGADRPADEGF